MAKLVERKAFVSELTQEMIDEGWVKIPSETIKELPNEVSYYYPLFKLFSDEHGLTLLESEIQDIIDEVKKFINH